MDAHGMLYAVVILLGAAVLVVAFSQRIGLGAVLGYLLAGVLIGPSGFKFITETENMTHVSELGVVFLLFIIGLELEPRRLWTMKARLFGLGAAQMLLVGGAVFALASAFGLPWKSALIAGLAFAMSSTAIALQIVRERHQMTAPGGSSAFAVLLFQDIAVLPILTLIPILAGREEQNGAPAWLIVTTILAVILVGRFSVRHVLRLVAGARLREVFTALSLLLVVGLAYLMQTLGVSMALGAFLGGVLLATSEYKHAIESDLEPFKGLFLGLFFMSVGMTLDLATVAQNPATVLGLMVGIIVLKLASHWLIAKAFRLPAREVPFFSSVIAQVGEFAFVVLASAASFALLDPGHAAVLTAVVALSMAATPLMMKVYDRFVAPRLAPQRDMSGETVENDEPEVLIAGFGRVGQIVGRLLYANRIRATVLDSDPEQIELLRRFGFKVYFGDATRLDLLEAAGARGAKILVVAVDGIEDSLKIVDLAKEHFPHLRLIVRARNVAHVYDLIDRGIEDWQRETFDSSLRMATQVLTQLGWSPYSAVRAGWKFRDHNLALVADLHTKRGDEAKLTSAARQARADLERMFSNERDGRTHGHDGWDVHPEGR